MLVRDETQTSGRLVEVGRVPAPARVASALGLPKRAKVLVRRSLVVEDGEPGELISSYLPVGLVEAAELESAQLWSGGTRAHLEARRRSASTMYEDTDRLTWTCGPPAARLRWLVSSAPARESVDHVCEAKDDVDGCPQADDESHADCGSDVVRVVAQFQGVTG